MNIKINSYILNLDIIIDISFNIFMSSREPN